MTVFNPNITIFNHSIPQIGYVARTITQGEEFELVNSYINYLLEKYKNLKQKKVAIFIEPQIDTGYPDLVVVEYYPINNFSWKHGRENLSVTDLKILFYIQTQKHTSINKINKILGFPINTIEKTINILLEYGLIHVSKTKVFVSNVPLSSFCRIHKIISIEAKIDKWSEAIRQASNNIWFSTESYILLKKETCKPEIVQSCKKHGIGIVLLNGNIRLEIKAEKRQFPVSYASLYFNEILLRKENLEV